MAPTPVHRDVARRVLIGTGTIAALILVGWIGAIVQTGGALPGRQYTYVKAMFGNVGTLNKGKDVKQDGLRIGQVSAISYVDGKAELTLRLDGKRDVFRNATAAIGNSSGLGKKFVSFDPGTADAGPLGSAAISLSRTASATSLEDVLSVFDPTTRAALQSALAELGEGTAAQADGLQALLARSPRLVADLKTITGTLAAPGTDLTGTMASADRLVHRFDGRQQQLAGLMTGAEQTLAAVGVDKGKPLAQAIGELPSTLASTRSALDDLYGPLGDARSAVHALRTGGAALGASTPTLRGFLRDAPAALDKVPGVARQAEPALSDLTRTIADARPLIEPITGATHSLSELLGAFSPYAGDAGRFFAQNALLSGTLGSPDKHYFAAELTSVGLFSLAGVPDPLYRSEPYPCPGTSYDHSTVTDCKGGVR